MKDKELPNISIIKPNLFFCLFYAITKIWRLSLCFYSLNDFVYAIRFV